MLDMMPNSRRRSCTEAGEEGDRDDEAEDEADGGNQAQRRTRDLAGEQRRELLLEGHGCAAADCVVDQAATVAVG